MQEVYVAIALAIIAAISGLVNKTINNRFKPTQVNAIVGFATDVVQAAEEAGRAFGYDGTQKLDYAKNALIALAGKLKVKLTPEEAEALIHAALKNVRDADTYAAATIDQAVSASYDQGVDYGISSVLDRIERQATEMKPATDEPLAA